MYARERFFMWWKQFNLMPMSAIYDQLDYDEKTALEVAIVYPHKPWSKTLRKFYKGSVSTLYNYRRKGADKLTSKGLLDYQGQPTALAFGIIPEAILRETSLKLRKELLDLFKEKSDIENAKFIIESELRKFQEEKKRLESNLRDLSSQLASIGQSKIRGLIQRFETFGINDNWIAVLTALNLVEMSMRYKLESLGIKPHGSFKELHDLLKREILEKENREIEVSSQFIRPKHLYDWRSKMDHGGLKVKIKEKEADFIIEQALKFIEELRIT